jgi:hypothetical protein
MSYNKIPPYIIGGNKNNLTEIEKKYCSCLMHVRPKIKNSYGICTKSIYNKKRRDKVINCDLYYDYNKYSKKELDAFSKEKKINSNINKQNRTKYILQKY